MRIALGLLALVAVTDARPRPVLAPCMTATATVTPTSLASPVLTLVRLTPDSGFVEGRWGPAGVAQAADSGLFYSVVWNLTMFDSAQTGFADSVIRHPGQLMAACNKYYYADSVRARTPCSDAICAKPFTCGTYLRDRTGTAIMRDTVAYWRNGNEHLFLSLAVFQCGFGLTRVPTQINP